MNSSYSIPTKIIVPTISKFNIAINTMYKVQSHKMQHNAYAVTA